MTNKIIRSVCLFTEKYEDNLEIRLNKLSKKLQDKGYLVQTMRICFKDKDTIKEMHNIKDKNILLSIGTVNYQQYQDSCEEFFCSNINFNIELSHENIDMKYIDLLFDMISTAPNKTFDFAFVFNNADSSAFFPSANYEKDGFVIGLQPTDLASGCESLEDWLQNMKNTRNEINLIFKDENDFLGIDSSIAPLFRGNSSLIDFIKKLYIDFDDSVLSDVYTRITKFIKQENPKKIGLCGLMFPCLEDFDLADEYEKGNFSIERNIFLSLHSGLGIDTYPIGIDEDKNKILNILKLVQALSNKYNKPLSVRFVSDGKAKIGDKTDFKNQYLKDVVIRKI